MKNTSNTLLLAALGLLAASTPLSGQVYSSASRSTAGAVGNSDSGDTQMSGDGRFVVFSSKASNLAGSDTNGFYDIYLRDTLLETCERITMGVGGIEPDSDSRFPAISDNGRFIVFGSAATNLISGDTNLSADVFLHDRTLTTTERVNITWLGAQSGGGGWWRDMVDVSDDGRYVAFCSLSGDLVPELTSNATRNVFVRDRTAATTTLVSIATGGSQSDGGHSPSITADGSKVAFVSGSWLIHPLDPDSVDDVFVWHSATRGIDLISLATTGVSGTGGSAFPRISPDGRFVVFQSSCIDLDPADTTTDLDIYLADRTAGTLEVVSYDVDGLTGPFTGCEDADMSADGRYVTFRGRSMTHAPNPGFGMHVYLRDRTLGTTEMISIPRWWFSGAVFGGERPQVADDASKVVFENASVGTPEEGAVFERQILARKRDGVTDRVSMITYNAASVGYALPITAYDAPAGSTAYVLWSTSVSGSSFAGHSFDLGLPTHLLGSATADSDGTVFWTSAPIPAAGSGHTVYLEMAIKSGSEWFDSNYVQFEIY